MNVMRKAVTTLGGIFLAVLLIAALAPKATRGVAAALVQVTNTGASPVPVEDQARQSVTLNIDAPAQDGFRIAFRGLSSPLFTMPAGKRLVIEQISGVLELPAGSVPTVATLHGTININSSFNVGYTAFLTTPTLTFFGSGSIPSQFPFSQSLRFYSDTPPTIDFAISGLPGTLVANAIGYLVDCTGACPAEQ